MYICILLLMLKFIYLCLDNILKKYKKEKVFKKNFH